MDFGQLFNQIKLLDETSHHNDASRKLDGVVYTPPHIAYSMVEQLKPSINNTILEPSCGRGVFIFSLIKYFHKKGHPFSEIATWGESKLFAQDIDELATQDLARLWQQFFQAHGVKSDISKQIKPEDGLFYGWADKSVDLIIGNPPYVRFQNLTESYRIKLQNKFITCSKGNVDLYYAFMEQAHKQSKRFCFIVPNSWMQTTSGKQLRNLLKSNVVSIIDFGAELIFYPVRAYTSIVLIENTPQKDFIFSHQLPNTENYTWEKCDDPNTRLKDSGWDLSFGLDTATSEKKLGDIANIYSGIATLSDASFTFYNGIETGDDILYQDPAFKANKSYLPRVFKLTKATSKASLLTQSARIFCPYDKVWKIIPETHLQENASLLLDIMKTRKAKLMQRDKGKVEKYEAWYAYGRRQGLFDFKPDEKLLLIPIMSNGILSPIEITPKELGGRFLFQSGFVLTAKGNNYDLLLQTLKSVETWNFLERYGKKWAGTKPYRTFGTQLLKTIPVIEK